ncbi:hypothetical protein DK867_06155 [Ochrobactrum sp. POC9]|nr:hypothetical protein DK867_06155 [Ochrobactrum sp. POC9]
MRLERIPKSAKRFSDKMRVKAKTRAFPMTHAKQEMLWEIGGSFYRTAIKPLNLRDDRPEHRAVRQRSLPSCRHGS